MSLFGLFTPYKFNIKSSLLVFIGLIQILIVDAYTKCSISVSLNKNGFHREMVYTVHITLPGYLTTTKCKSALEMTLPGGAYLDPDQVNDLKSPQVLFDSPVDVEAPEHVSSNQTVLVYTDLQNTSQNEFTAEIVLPVHLRYHRSEHSKPFKTVHFSTPNTIFIDCLDGMYTTYELQCSRTSNKICTWSKLKCKCRIKSTQAIIPVGNLDHLLIVAVITTLTTICGTIILLYQLKSQLYKMNSKIL